MKYRRILSIILLICVVLCLGACKKNDKVDKKTDNKVESTTEETATYNATLLAINDVKVYPGATGLVVECNAKEGDYVDANTLLYKLDDTDVINNIASARNAIAKSQVSLDAAQADVNNLSIYASSSGILKDFSIKKGERVNATTIGYIADETSFVARVPFNDLQLESISVGMSATVTAGDLMGSVTGKVTRIYAEQNNTIAGTTMHDVEITGANVGGLVEGLSVSATVNGQASPISGVIDSAHTTAVVSKGSGNATAVYAKEGDFVKQGQLIVQLENQSFSSTLRRVKLEKQDNERKLETYLNDQKDLSIYAPISGVVTECKKSEHDSIATKSDYVMVISDTSKLTSTLELSDKDYKKISIGSVLKAKCDGFDSLDAIVTNKDDDTREITIEIDNTLGVSINTIATILFE